MDVLTYNLPLRVSLGVAGRCVYIRSHTPRTILKSQLALFDVTPNQKPPITTTTTTEQTTDGYQHLPLTPHLDCARSDVHVGDSIDCPVGYSACQTEEL